MTIQTETDGLFSTPIAINLTKTNGIPDNCFIPGIDLTFIWFRTREDGLSCVYCAHISIKTE